MKKIYSYKKFNQGLKVIKNDNLSYTLMNKKGDEIGFAQLSQNIPIFFGKKEKEKSYYLSLISVDSVGENHGKILLNYILDDLKFEYLYLNSAEKMTGNYKGLEVWSHPYWDRVCDKVGIIKRESNIIPGKFIYETLYRLSSTQIEKSEN